MLNFDKSLQFGEIEYGLRGSLAMYSRIETRSNRMSGPIPTCSALEQTTKQIYWHPCIDIRIVEAKILSEVRYTTMGFNHRDDIERKTKQANQSYLCDPSYLVRAVLFWNADRQDLKNEWRTGKHLSIMQRHIKKENPRFPIVLGTTECTGEIFYINKPWDKYESPYKGITDFGLMYYGKNFKTGDLYLKRMQGVDGVVDYSKTTDLITIK